MNVSCTNCDTVFRVDPRKVPSGGVRARCSECRHVFRIAPEPVRGGEPAPTGDAASAAESNAAPAPTAAISEPPREAPRFGGQNRDERARRLARALVSDMITYHPDRHQHGLREGTLRQDFREEIRKSWEEYVDQVGKETAHGTPFFRDALNQILARGQQVF